MAGFEIREMLKRQGFKTEKSPTPEVLGLIHYQGRDK
jgi:hypothetical protein